MRAFGVTFLALEVSQHQIVESTFALMSSSVMHPFAISTASLPSRLQHLWGHAAQGVSALWARAGGAAGVAHLQSKMRSIASSF